MSLQRRSHAELVAHIVWTTRGRDAVLSPEVEAWLGTFVRDKAREIGCEVLAFGAASDHVHVLLRLAATVSIADAVKSLKGAASRAWNHREGATGRLEWQAGYWVESCDPRDLAELVEQIRAQREVHAIGSAREDWEAVYENAAD